MSGSDREVKLLKNILVNINDPDNLDNHPWVNSLMVDEAINNNPGFSELSPGRRLIKTICNLFPKMMPDVPPKRGIRLDNHWGEFGIVAAQYFAPLLFNYPQPLTLKEAWQEIDKAILLFVNANQPNLDEKDLNQYRIIGSEKEIAPYSTISDWHRKGIEQFAKCLIRYERQLETDAKISSSISVKNFRGLRRLVNKFSLPHVATIWIKRAFLIFLLVLSAVGTWKVINLYQRAKSLQSQAYELVSVADSLNNSQLSDIDEFKHIGQEISNLRLGLESFQDDLYPIIKVTPYLYWIPIYGGDLSQAPLLLEMAVQLSITGDELFQAISPVLPSYLKGNQTDILYLLSQFNDTDTQLVAAQVSIANIQNIRQEINTDNLSPNLATIINEKIDPLLSSIETSFPVTDVLQMAQLTPRLLGAVGNGTQTYMILIQNEDELRPTGGFLTAVGLLQIENGEIKSLSFESSDLVDDLTQPYPKAPWQLDEYMMSEILLFRDSNWFTDFPTTVEWAKFLYSYTRSKKIDGVISIDQQVIIDLLKIVGPIQIEEVDNAITADNVLSYMRTAKEQTPPKGISKDKWDRKQFIERMAEPLITKLQTLDRQSLPDLMQQLIQLLDEKHILLQFDDPEMSNLINQRGWDGAIQPDEYSDFLMVVDSNIGFNKTNALMENQIDYFVDLSDLDLPISSLTISQKNNSQQNDNNDTECIQNNGPLEDLELSEREYIMNDCYWSYLRIYTFAGTELISSTPHEIPEKWLLREQAIPAKTDVLNENISGVQAFGTILVVPKSKTLQTNFTYKIPEAVIKFNSENNSYTYHLKIKKQPGTTAVPFNFHFKLPPQGIIISAPNELHQTQNEWELNTSLREDLIVEIVFEIKN